MTKQSRLIFVGVINSIRKTFTRVKNLPKITINWDRLTILSRRQIKLPIVWRRRIIS